MTYHNINYMESSITTQAYVVEDNRDIGQKCIRHSGIDRLIDYCAIIDDFDSFSNNILLDEHPKVFIIDVNLGTGREEDGIKMIEIARKKCPDALIIVHTAYEEFEDRCVEAGAKHFFVKSKNYENNMQKIYHFVDQYLRKKGINIKTVEFRAQIAHIDPAWVTLECKYEDQELVKRFPSGPIQAALQDFYAVDAEIKIRIVQKNTEVKILVERIESEKRNTPKPGLLDSEIWNNKLK